MLATMLFGLIVLIVFPNFVMATEEPKYTTEASAPGFEIRKYSEMLIAETEVDSDFESAGNLGFRVLADYIFGNDHAQKTMAMTAPVNQLQSERVPMAAPVSVTNGKLGYWVQFIMPANYSLETLPVPADSRIRLCSVLGCRVAVHRYAGDWSQGEYDKQLVLFLTALKQAGIKTSGQPVFARYDSPFWPWFLWRNEIWLELAP